MANLAKLIKAQQQQQDAQVAQEAEQWVKKHLNELAKPEHPWVKLDDVDPYRAAAIARHIVADDPNFFEAQQASNDRGPGSTWEIRAGAPRIEPPRGEKHWDRE
jgi:hypothetical protein